MAKIKVSFQKSTRPEEMPDMPGKPIEYVPKAQLDAATVLHSNMVAGMVIAIIVGLGLLIAVIVLAANSSSQPSPKKAAAPGTAVASQSPSAVPAVASQPPPVVSPPVQAAPPTQFVSHTPQPAPVTPTTSLSSVTRRAPPLVYATDGCYRCHQNPSAAALAAAPAQEPGWVWVEVQEDGKHELVRRSYRHMQSDPRE